MTLVQVYAQFREHPKAEGLAQDANFSYVSSGIVFAGQQAILEHLAKNEHEINCKETIISCHETAVSLVLEVETHVEFVRGPGSFLPGMSANFVADEKVSMIVVHIVMFNESQQISAVRYIWDQATLLKQLNVIGARGNAWPICTGNDQIAICKKRMVVPATAQLSRSTTVGLSESPMKSWPKQVNIFDGSPLMENVPVPTKAIEPPSPSARPPTRTLQNILDLSSGAVASPRLERTTRPPPQRPRPQSAYFNMFGGDDEPQPYTPVVGSGGGGYNNSRKGLKAHWTQWHEESKENSM
jgi:hypothetical protein